MCSCVSFFLVFGNRIFVCNLDWPETLHHLDSASRVLSSQACTTMSRFSLLIFKMISDFWIIQNFIDHFSTTASGNYKMIIGSIQKYSLHKFNFRAHIQKLLKRIGEMSKRYLQYTSWTHSCVFLFSLGLKIPTLTPRAYIKTHIWIPVASLILMSKVSHQPKYS